MYIITLLLYYYLSRSRNKHSERINQCREKEPLNNEIRLEYFLLT